MIYSFFTQLVVLQVKTSWNLHGNWKVVIKDWSIMPYSMLDEKLNGAYFNDLDPGKYAFLY